MLPLSSLAPRSRLCRFVRLLSWAGILPLSWFPPSPLKPRVRDVMLLPVSLQRTPYQVHSVRTPPCSRCRPEASTGRAVFRLTDDAALVGRRKTTRRRLARRLRGRSRRPGAGCLSALFRLATLPLTPRRGKQPRFLCVHLNL